MMNDFRIAVPASVEISYDSEARCWQSFCPELEVYSAGNSKEDAERGLMEAIRMTLASYYRHGRLNEFLSKKQFVPNVTPVRAEDEALVLIQRDGGDAPISPDAVAV